MNINEKKLLFITLVIYSFTCLSQENLGNYSCAGVTGADQFSCEDYYSASIDPQDLAQYDPIVFNIFYWAVNPTDWPEPMFYEEHALQSIAALNMAFNQFNIFFKYAGYDNSSWNDDQFSFNSSYFQIIDEAAILGFKKPDAFNFYVPYQYSHGGGGVATMWSTTCSNNVGSFRNSPHSGVHEVAHCLGLHHIYRQSGSSVCERVTRDVSNPSFNADEKGDCVVDTAASPRFQLGGLEDLDTFNCIYTGIGEDCDSTPYEIYEEDVRNLMAGGNWAYSEGHCRRLFTLGQGIRMRESIVIADYKYEHAMTTISSLYEPYTGVYGSLESSEVANPPTFQPGFDYEFRACTCDNVDALDCSHPCEFDETSFQNNHTIISSYPADHSNYSQITHPNHSSIRILQLSQFGVRRCYDNWSQPSIGGVLTTFNDGVINANVTVQPKDSIQINDSNLINGLPNGLYKVDKYYEDGATRQKVVSKEN